MQPLQLFILFLVVLLMEMTASAALKTALSASITATERSFLCSDGIKLAAQHWKSSSNNNTKHRILCLHGWLDNCRSFHLLAPSLVSSLADSELVALDFVGHGLSAHKSVDGGAPTVMSEAAFYVAETIRHLQWNSFTLVGHSMGAAVSLIYAAAFPEQVSSLVLLEGAGPLSRRGEDVGKHVRAAIERRQTGNPTLYPEFSNDATIQTKQARIYPSIDVAVETRCKTASLSPGNQYLSVEASRAMVERATMPSNDGSGVQFRHDVRLQWPSLQYMTNEQVEGLFQDVTCPVCLLLAKDGWPVDPVRKQAVLSILKPSVLKTLPGSHHFHADPDTSEQVVNEIVDFLKSVDNEE